MSEFKSAATRPNPNQWRAALAALLLWAPVLCCAGADVYAFTDGDGEIHLSNVPDDQRYSLLALQEAPEVTPPRTAGLRKEPAASILRRPYAAVIERAALRYGVEAALLHAVIAVESAYDSRARSSRGAAGLMQLMPKTASRYGVTDVFDPVENVRAGAQYLHQLLTLFDNDLQLALAAYNAGEAAVIKHGNRIPPYPETAAYVPLVLSNYQKNRSSM